MRPRFLHCSGKPACLLPPHAEDIDLFLKLQNEVESRQYFLRYWPIGQGAELEWIAKANTTQTDAVFTIATYPKRKPIGSIGLHRINWKDRHATVGIGILEDYCNKGMGTCASMLLVAWALLELGLNKVAWHSLETNPRSIVCAKRLGGIEVGRLKRHHFRNGKYVDDVILEIYPERFVPLWHSYSRM